MVTLLQYFLTVLSQPGYVPEVLHELTVADAKDSRLSLYTRKDIHVLTYGEGTSHGATSNGKHPSHVRNTFEGSTHMPLPNRNNPCQHCKLWQPLRSRHCHDCDKCVLKFDHHCALLGTCIGQGNHCRFWWYILAESTLCTWTSVKYIISIHTEIYTEWWHGGIEIILVIALILCLIILLILLFFHSYLVLTNQTTYELIRRHRIPYLRTLPNHIHPFSKGILRNLKEFCCPTGCYTLYSLPTREELEHKIQPYTCQDVLSCRCC